MSASRGSVKARRTRRIIGAGSAVAAVLAFDMVPLAVASPARADVIDYFLVVGD